MRGELSQQALSVINEPVGTEGGREGGRERRPKTDRQTDNWDDSKKALD